MTPTSHERFAAIGSTIDHTIARPRRPFEEATDSKLQARITSMDP